MEEAKAVGPLIIAMKGHPGTGKSTVARSLAAALHCPLIDKDDARDSTLTLQLSCPTLPPNLLNDLSYNVVFRIAATQLGLGLGVVVDSPLSRRAHLDRLQELAEGARARLFVVECKPEDEAEWRRRLELRGKGEAASGHKPATWRDMERLLEGYGGCTEYDVGDVEKMVLDTTADVGVGELVSAVLRFIDSSEGQRLDNC